MKYLTYLVIFFLGMTIGSHLVPACPWPVLAVTSGVVGVVLAGEIVYGLR
jgi:hypothetical protein